MFEFLFPRPSPNGEELPSPFDLQSACLAYSSTELSRLIIQQEQSLLDTCAQNPGIEVAIFYLFRLHPSALYPVSGTLRRRPDSLTPAQHLLERAACHGNAALVRHLLATYTDLDIRNETLGALALTGGVEIWKALLEKSPPPEEYALRAFRLGRGALCIVESSGDFAVFARGRGEGGRRRASDLANCGDGGEFGGD